MATLKMQLIPLDEFEKKLIKKKKLKVKFGMDPTAPDLHLGHAVVLGKLREFQDAGHEIILVIGDFTAKIGDPTGKSKTRPPLSNEEISHNAQTYLDQVGKILDINKTKICRNSQWLSTISLNEWIKIAGKVTLARLIEREDFQNRLTQNIPIGFHELFYPLLQAYDSVELNADIELGGTDQTFNLLMGRFLQEQFGKEPQVILTMPILVGLDGHDKMSKSLKNYVGLFEPADKAYGKLMSISDSIMWPYFKLLLLKSDAEIEKMKSGIENGTIHPMKLKKEMAYEIVKRFWSEEGAELGQKTFEALFQTHDYSKAQEVKINFVEPIWIIELLKNLDAIKSSSEGRRLIEAGAVHIDEQVVKDFNAKITCKSGMIVRVGKLRIYKIV